MNDNDQNTGADLVLRHCTLLTMDDHCRVITNGALAMGRGAIVAIGDDAEVSSLYPASPSLELHGHAVLPGLINCHTHAPMTLFRGMADDKELMDWLENYIFPVESKVLSPGFVRCGSQLAFWEMLRGGTTSIVDMYMYEDLVAEEASRIGLRGIFGQALIDFPTPEFGSWSAMMEGMEAFAQRWKGHPLITPAVGPHAPYTVSTEHLKECQALAVKLDLPLVIHLAETQNEHKLIQSQHGASPVTYLDRLGLLTKRMIAAHVVWPDDEEIALLAKGGVGVGHCPQSNAKLASGIAPVVKLLRHGVAVGLGTDGAASNNDLDMWQEMQTANFLQKLHCGDATVLNCRETLELATCGAARAAHIDHLVGSLEVGKRADVIAVRIDQPHQQPVYDPISQLVYATKSTDVRWVFVDGRPVMHAGKVFAIHEEELLGRIGEEAARVRHLMNKS